MSENRGHATDGQQAEAKPGGAEGGAPQEQSTKETGGATGPFDIKIGTDGLEPEAHNVEPETHDLKPEAYDVKLGAYDVKLGAYDVKLGYPGQAPGPEAPKKK